MRKVFPGLFVWNSEVPYTRGGLYLYAILSLPKRGHPQFHCSHPFIAKTRPAALSSARRGQPRFHCSQPSIAKTKPAALSSARRGQQRFHCSHHFIAKTKPTALSSARQGAATVSLQPPFHCEDGASHPFIQDLASRAFILFCAWSYKIILNGSGWIQTTTDLHHTRRLNLKCLWMHS